MIEVLLVGDTPPDALGLIPFWLSSEDPRPARDQLHENYGHGGGWRPQSGFTMLKGMTLRYPGDPPFKPIAVMRLRDEMIAVYDCGYVCILQKNGTFEVSRMD